MTTEKKSKPAILYVDDEPHNLTTFTAIFRRYYTIYTSTSARDAIQILHEHPVDLIITDQRMPEMTGVQFLEAIIPDYPEPVRMILTGFSDIDAIIKAINNGSVLRYLTKPWDENELKQNIDVGIKLHALEQQNRQMLKDLKQELSQQKQIISVFEKYVPKHNIEQVLSLSELSAPNAAAQLKNEGEERIISVLFSDIRQFTHFSEHLHPKKVVEYLNSYLGEMINCVTKNQGTIYKLLGDGLIALFGAPVSSIYNQRNAVFCALDMIEALKQFNKTFEKDINHETAIGIGISTGEVTVGHVVTEHFLSYTAVGDTVDAAIKIEELTKEKPNTLLISESTYARVQNDVVAEKWSNDVYQVFRRK